MKALQITIIFILFSISTFAQVSKQAFGDINYLKRKKIEYKTEYKYNGNFSNSGLGLLSKSANSTYMKKVIKPKKQARANSSIITNMPVLSPDSIIDYKLLAMKPDSTVRYHMRYGGQKIENKFKEGNKGK